MSQLAIEKVVLYRHWATETPIVLKGKPYRVGRMSYGDYFLEPGQPKGETKPFNEGTLWPTVQEASRR